MPSEWFNADAVGDAFELSEPARETVADATLQATMQDAEASPSDANGGTRGSKSSEQGKQDEPDVTARMELARKLMGSSSPVTRSDVPEPDDPPSHQPALEPDLDLSQLDLSALSTDRPGRRAGRVKTRLLGFDHGRTRPADPFSGAPATATREENDPEPASVRFPVGWIVVTHGPGRGASFAIGNGVSQIGRGSDQAIKLDYGDTSISRSNHAAVAYDDEQNAFFLGHGGKANIVRLNGRPVVSTEPLRHLDVIRIGSTSLLFAALCGPEFRWDPDEEAQGHLE